MVRTFKSRIRTSVRSAWLGLHTVVRTLAIRTASLASGASLVKEEGQTTAEYALVILAAAAVAVVLIAWAKSSGKLPAFFDKIIDDISSNA
jgi:Flp pilus assembly pilin Flp